ncbi:9132_t:CDS:2 [Dentiscutata heterogama]|uniref:9132_t:CDS:1 n=1 Tax=Dentiscutata heterogama TaxID=1316150 RepID=A0ACA9LC54_9GLOM|nr:9132_t:CDS:2 [Dentiscutata heterogama]
MALIDKPIFLSLYLIYLFIYTNHPLIVHAQSYANGPGTLPDVPALRTCNGIELDIRNYDGTCNNLNYSNWGTLNRIYDRGSFPAIYKESITGEPAIKIDARMISNMLSDSGQEPVFSGSPLTDDTLSSTRKSMFEVFFGQFVNHDLEDAALQAIPRFMIGNVTNDKVFSNAARSLFNPSQTPYMTSSLSWGRIINSTLYPVNFANSYLDLSTIYGKDNDTAYKLRTLKDGKLITENFIGNGGAYNTALNNLTIENVPPSSGKVNITPSLLPPTINTDDALVSGDARCSENIQLCIMHTLWIREHNYWVDKIAKEKPELKNDEEIFQYARKMTIGEYQKVIFEEYLPAALGVKMPSYSGYNDSLSADTSIHFAGVAFRYGHSNVRPYDLIDGCTGEPFDPHPDFKFPDSHSNRIYFMGKSVRIPSPYQGLNFTDGLLDYTPVRILTLASGSSGKGLDNIIISMLRAPSKEFGLIFSSTLRNMPGVNDMAAMDIARGRLLGLPDYDTFRSVYHPAGSVYNNQNCNRSSEQDSVECFNVIVNNMTIAKNLQQIYGKANKIDSIIGLFAESKGQTTPLPPTISAMIKEEFLRKRSADRFWYEGSKYTSDEIELIKNTTMRDIIMRNTDIQDVQANPFKSPGSKDSLANIKNCDSEESE